MSEKINSIDLVEKALLTNGCKILELSEPRFNPICIQQKIDALDKEIETMRHKAFATKFETNGAGLNNVTCLTSGIDIDILKSKIAIRESLICNLKSLELLNKK